MLYIVFSEKRGTGKSPRKYQKEKDGHRLEAVRWCGEVFARELLRGNAQTGHLRYGVKSA